MIHIPEGRQLFPQMSVQENLILGSYSKKYRIHQKENLETVMALFPRLKTRLRQKAGSMSGGEQQMVAIGRALMATPKLLIVDEMSLGLAPVLVKELFSVIEEINKKGVTILLVEQNVKSALAIAHRALVMENGRISMSGPADQMLNNEHIRKAYLGL
jgi:branched-chain amino acid transport system ATP-binding protein